MAYGDCLLMQDREFVLHSELLKKSGSGHKIKIKEREREKDQKNQEGLLK